MRNLVVYLYRLRLNSITFAFNFNKDGCHWFQKWRENVFKSVWRCTRVVLCCNFIMFLIDYHAITTVLQVWSLFQVFAATFLLKGFSHKKKIFWYGVEDAKVMQKVLYSMSNFSLHQRLWAFKDPDNSPLHTCCFAVHWFFFPCRFFFS